MPTNCSILAAQEEEAEVEVGATPSKAAAATSRAALPRMTASARRRLKREMEVPPHWLLPSACLARTHVHCVVAVLCLEKGADLRGDRRGCYQRGGGGGGEATAIKLGCEAEEDRCLSVTIVQT